MSGSNHGGARPGAGRKPNAEKYAEPLRKANDHLAYEMPEVVKALLDIALGRKVDEEWVAAGTVTRKDVLRINPDDTPTFLKAGGDDDEADDPRKDGIWLDEKGKPVTVDVPVFPDLPPEAMVLIRRRPLRPDVKALAYIWDRLEGKPIQAAPPEAEGADLREALAKVKQRMAAYRDPDEPEPEDGGGLYHGA